MPKRLKSKRPPVSSPVVSFDSASFDFVVPKRERPSASFPVVSLLLKNLVPRLSFHFHLSAPFFEWPLSLPHALVHLVFLISLLLLPVPFDIQDCSISPPLLVFLFHSPHVYDAQPLLAISFDV